MLLTVGKSLVNIMGQTWKVKMTDGLIFHFGRTLRRFFESFGLEWTGLDRVLKTICWSELGCKYLPSARSLPLAGPSTCKWGWLFQMRSAPQIFPSFPSEERLKKEIHPEGDWYFTSKGVRGVLRRTCYTNRKMIIMLVGKSSQSSKTYLR